MDTIVKVALGVFCGALLIFLFRIAYIHYVFKEVTEMVSETNQAILQSSQNSIKLQREKIEARKQAEILKIRIEERKVELERVNQDKKDKAWRAFYKNPEECLSYKSDKHMVECANMRIRAKREFEEKWRMNQ